MKNFATSRFRLTDFLDRYGFLIFSLGLALFSFTLLPDYGFVGDTPKNLAEGRINLDYLLGGKTPTAQDQVALAFQIHGAFFFMCSEIAKRLLSDTLGWIDPVSARHVLLPVCVFFFMNAYFNFLKKNTNSVIAWTAAIILWTFPRFWGLIFNDIKDVPLLLFFSLSIFFFYEWIRSQCKKTPLLYAGSVMLGLGMANKIYVLLAPLIVLAWWITLELSENRLLQDIKKMFAEPFSQDKKKIWLHVALCCGIIFFLVAVFFMPAFFAIAEKTEFLKAKSSIVRNNLFSVFSKGWNLYPWIQIFTVTPCLVLITGILGFFRAILKPASKPFDLLMVVWFFLNTLIFCTPALVVYQGIRLFLPFLVPFCYFSGRGTFWIAEVTGPLLHVKKKWLAGILAGLIFVTQLFGLVDTHPYQSAFFNALAGGLKGAQQKKILDANDFWNVSSLESSRWLNENLPQGSTLFFSTASILQLHTYYGVRPDIHYDFVNRTPLPRHVFLLDQPSTHRGKSAFGVYHEEIQKETSNMIKVYEVRRQGGLIFAVYYKP